MNLLTMVPFRTDANLGRAYNDAMCLLDAHDWACFLDHDAMPTTGRWHAQLVEAIESQPDAGAFVAMTNRIASSWQRCGPDGNDVAIHRKFGADRVKVRTLLDITHTKGFGGVMFAVSKSTWQQVGGFADGLGCVDHSLHFKLQDAGKRVWLVEGLYVYHWRHFGEADPTSQYPKAANCRCRGVELMPTDRVRL